MSVVKPGCSATLMSFQQHLWLEPREVVLSLGDTGQCMKTVWVITAREEEMLASSG